MVALVAFIAARDRRLMLVAASFVAVAALAAAESDSVQQRLHVAISEVESSAGARHHHVDRPAYGIRPQIDRTDPRTTRALGWGTGSYAMEYCRIAKSPEWCKLGAYNPHNQFLFFAAQFGLLGLVAPARPAGHRRAPFGGWPPEKMLRFCAVGHAGGAFAARFAALHRDRGHLVSADAGHPGAGVRRHERGAQRTAAPALSASTSSTDGHSG